ncbi:uncharacterized protein LOC105383162 [Plutella xylostella]|uniref:uncharacterized protein LOC105383162 n=1 Tax=Plutella xylostella TaxID=51655 RepID=UPI002032ED55|nr:uncharacterized protein LOC105383162 [Plutella xylostella]
MLGRLTSVCVLMCLLQRPVFTNTDNLALLTGTLKMMQRAACDDETVALTCPRSTAITIQVAQYGRMTPEGHTCLVDRNQHPPVAVEVVGNEKCLWPNSMQYSLLQTVVEACQKKPQCQFSTRPKPGLMDPCPHARKFVEVAYKCRPNEFRIQTVCEDDVIKLNCNPQSRVAVYDAQYGRAAHEPLMCPQPQGVNNKTCMTAHATETVMQLCHGKRHCEVAANSKNFGTPCRPDTRTNLKIVYACVPLGVLIERYEKPLERDEVTGQSLNQDQGGLFDDGAGEKWGEPAPALANPDLPYPDVVESETFNNDEEARNEVMDLDSTEHQSNNIWIYIGVGAAIFFILIIMLIAVRYFIRHRSTRTSKTGDLFTTEVPNVFNDASSDIDNDIDVTHISGTFYEHPDMILYRDVPGKGTIKAMRPMSTIYPCAGSSMYGHVDRVTHTTVMTDSYRKDANRDVDAEIVVSPKTLQRYSDSQYYFG